MSKSPEELLALQVGDATVAENLKRAVEMGELVEEEDGCLRFAEPRQQSQQLGNGRQRAAAGLRFSDAILVSASVCQVRRTAGV